LRAPAKVNLGLRVLGRRPDGYHWIESLFVPLVDLADEVDVESGPGSGVDLELAGDLAGVPAGPENLAARAGLAFLREARLGAALRIRVEKRIPAAAGLGGGSSDAGAVLRGLAACFPGRLDPERLRALALDLGADVPFFLDPRPARVRGIGERIEPVRGLPALPLVLANPGIPLSTAEVYRAFDAAPGGWTGTRPDATLAAPSGLLGEDGRLQSGGLASFLETVLQNDLEPAAVRLCPSILELREQMQAAGALGVGLSGSGPTVFGVFPDARASRRALERCFPAPGPRAWVATTAAST
jgi:4-diphosphocytidyl-2-C-methyl-D-erythritol kinase